MIRSLLCLAIALTSLSVDARIKRSSSAKAEFQRHTICPSRGTTGGNCKGYVVDHIKPLACGGADRPSNMQYQTKADAKAKDKWERKGC